MDVNQIKAWAFDKQMQLESAQQKVEQFGTALTRISELVGLPPGETPLQTLIDAVGAVVAERNGANAQQQ